MHILHGTWIPQAEEGFIQTGAFYLWVETEGCSRQRRDASVHPRHLSEPDLLAFLTNEVGIRLPSPKVCPDLVVPRYFWLPTAKQQPLPSLELSRYLEEELPEEFGWQLWQVDCCRAIAYVNLQFVPNVLSLLNDLHFIARYNLAEVQLGTDLLFWHQYCGAFKQVIFKDEYVPAMRCRLIRGASETAEPRSRTKSSQKTSSQSARKSSGKLAEKRKQPREFELYPAWDIIGDRYEANLKEYASCMPWLCTAGFATHGQESQGIGEAAIAPQFYNREALLRHFSEVVLAEIVTHTPVSQVFLNTIEGSLVHHCLRPKLDAPWRDRATLGQCKQWRTWRDRISRSQTAAPFYLCFQLQDPMQPEDPWEIQFQVAAKENPSLRVSLQDIWRLRASTDVNGDRLGQQFGDDFEQHLLLNLGYAARIYPKIWDGLETDEPTGIFVPLEIAFEFLKESAWVLEDAGYKVIVPAWWTPQGRQRSKVRLRAKGKSASGSGAMSKRYFSKDMLVQYQYELAIGDRAVSEEEWHQLVNTKVPLVQFRGQWMELDKDKMRQMVAFWQQQQQDHPELSLLEFMKLSSQGDEALEVVFDREDELAIMLGKLTDKSHLEPASEPTKLQATLRDYQKRGLSWLSYLEQLGLNGCLADDMGLGKTIQAIARLVQEREEEIQDGSQRVPPTLLIAPTSVLGNWQRELHKFAPHLRVAIHHGGDRLKDTKAFKTSCREHDVTITSYTLARKDAKLLSSITWGRVVLDEAQNIKNPKSAQTKAILKLSSDRRLALTGTPVENRLLDLWSIFNFLNPGYLGTQAQFRKQFEIPIQKESNRTRSATLKKLVEPFILRRVKTDRAIIQDLPEKVEQKLYCNLTQEQASLYEAVVREVSGEIDTAEGIQRRGLILATLTKLKQICNHPRQFLQDGSDFTTERSHKLSRLSDMLAEAIAEGESALVFTQFTDLGDALEKYLRHTCRHSTYYIHGGTSRQKREQAIAAFQDPDTEPSVFLLSLKAGGVGITLTKANHVFHFDRWWNPAVEDQATDRAFRIGQQKNVFVHKFVAIGTLEERIDEMIEDKKKLAGAIVGADESWLTELDNESFKQLIALNKSAILE